MPKTRCHIYLISRFSHTNALSTLKKGQILSLRLIKVETRYEKSGQTSPKSCDTLKSALNHLLFQ